MLCLASMTLRAALVVGLGWLLMTLAFEFGFGRLRGRSWAELLVDYDLRAGRIWVLVLVVTALAPLLASWMHGASVDPPTPIQRFPD